MFENKNGIEYVQNNKIQIEKNKEQIEKDEEQIMNEMFKFAEENNLDSVKIFEYIIKNGKNEKHRMQLWGLYVIEITKINISQVVREEAKREFLGILEYSKTLLK